MSRLLVIAAGLFLLAACEGGVTSGQVADDGRAEIDCSSSYLSMSLAGKYKCEQFARTQATGGDRAGGIFQSFDLYGRADDGTLMILFLYKALLGGYLRPSSSVSYEQLIQGLNETTRKAQNWSPIRTVFGSRTMDFTDSSGQSACFGFHQFGDLIYGGFGRSLSGYFCRPNSTMPAYSDDEKSSLLNKIVVRASASPTIVSTPAPAPVSAPAPARPAPAAGTATPVFDCQLPNGSSMTTTKPACEKAGGSVQESP